MPAGGYPAKVVGDFDSAFGTLIDQLNSAWSGGSIGAAIGTMFSLYGLAQVPLPATDTLRRML